MGLGFPGACCRALGRHPTNQLIGALLRVVMDSAPGRPHLQAV